MNILKILAALFSESLEEFFDLSMKKIEFAILRIIPLYGKIEKSCSLDSRVLHKAAAFIQKIHA